MKAYTTSVAPAPVGRAPRQAGSDAKSALRDAFLSALVRRVPRGGTVTLPTGIVDCGELGRILAALDRAQAEGDR